MNYFRSFLVPFALVSFNVTLAAQPVCNLRVENLFNAHALQEQIERRRSEEVIFYDAALNSIVPELRASPYNSPEVIKSNKELLAKVALSKISQFIEAGQLVSMPSAERLSNLVRIELQRESRVGELVVKVAEKLNGASFADHVQFVIDHYGNSNHSTLRSELISSLAYVPGGLVDYASSMRILTGYARGFKTVEFSEPKLANEAIRTLQERVGQDPLRLPEGVAIESHSPAVRMLFEPIRNVEVFNPSGTHGNVNGVFIVSFASGLRAVFKPADGELYYGHKHSNWIHFKNEANAFHIFETLREQLPREIARDPGVFVPASIEAAVSFEGRHYGIGSLQLFAEGYETLKTVKERDSAYFDRLNSHPDMAVARMMKVILGDYDSFPHRGSPNGNLGNIMARDFGNRLRIALIDNGVGRVDGVEGSYYQVNEAPVKEHIPTAWRQAIKKIDTQRLRDRYIQRRLLNPGGLDNMIGRIRQLQEKY